MMIVFLPNLAKNRKTSIRSLYRETYRTRTPNQRVHSHTGHGKRAGYGREIGHRAEST